MRLIFTTHPVPAHIDAMLPIARALSETGHDVAFACAESARRHIEEAGFPAFAAGLDWSGSEPDRYFPDLRGRSSDDRRVWFMSGLFGGLAAQRMIPDLLALCHTWRPAVIVRNDFEFGGALVAERTGLAHVTIGVDLGITPPFLKILAGRSLAYLRNTMHLPRDPECTAPYGAAYIGLLPPMCQFAEFAALPFVHPVRAVTVVPVAESAGAADNPERRPVALGFDPSVSAARPVLDLVLEAVEPRGTPVSAFSEASCVVTDGNLVTVLEAVACGVPVLLIPTAGTQSSHLAQWSALGIGRLLQPPRADDARSAGCFVDSVRAAADCLLTEPRYRRNAARCAAEMASLPGLETVAGLVAGVAACGAVAS
jgi:hypothetical protein